MKIVNRFLTLSLLAGILFTPLRVQADTSAESLRYTVEEGDTLKELAIQHLGGAQYILELMEYNEIANPSSVVPGTELIIPLSIRQYALDEIAQAEEHLTSALNAMADKFAPVEYKDASSILDKAQTARSHAKYDQAQALGAIAQLTAKHAEEAANENAIAKQQAEVISVFGDVEYSKDGGTTWEAAIEGMNLAANTLLRTSPDSISEIHLADKSSITLKPDSTFTITTQEVDRRTNRRTSKLQVILGDILGEITPRENEESKFEVHTSGASIAIRGTDLHVGTDKDQLTRVSLLSGQTSVKSGSKEVDLKEGYGIVAKKGKKPSSPIKLPRAPEWKSPSTMAFSTFTQEVALEWSSQRGLKHYLLEMAKDKDFRYPLLVEELRKPRFTTEPLKPGTYYVRVASINKKDLQGPYSETTVLTIDRDLRIHMTAGGKLFKIGGKLFANADHYVTIHAENDQNSIEEIFYSVNDEKPEPFRGQFTLEDEGQYTIHAWAQGPDGFKGEVNKLDLYVDLNPPEVSYEILAPPGGDLTRRDARMILKPTDPSSIRSVVYSINGGEERDYTDAPPVILLDDLYFEYRAIDGVGNDSGIQTIQIMGTPVRR